MVCFVNEQNNMIYNGYINISKNRLNKFSIPIKKGGWTDLILFIFLQFPFLSNS